MLQAYLLLDLLCEKLDQILEELECKLQGDQKIRISADIK